MLLSLIQGRTETFKPARVLIIVKQTLKELVQASGQEGLKRLLADDSQDRERIEKSHREHIETLAHVVGVLTDHGIRSRCVERQPGEHFDLEAEDELVITIGGDGTVLDASHSITNDVPVLAINSAPSSSFGHFCLTNRDGFEKELAAIMSGKRKSHKLLRLKLTLDGEVIAMPVLNEVLIAHSSPAGTSRCKFSLPFRTVEHKSSGLLICTPSGSTGFNRSAGGAVHGITDGKICYHVREPFIRPGETCELRTGFVDRKQKLTITSEMLDGTVFIDGAHVSREFNRGSVLTIEAHESDLNLFVDPRCHDRYMNKA